MTLFVEPPPDVGVRTGELVWGPGEPATQGRQQENGLMRMIDSSDNGVIVDCAQVEEADSELIALLMRLRTHASGHNKNIAFFNVPRSLRHLITSQNLRLALPVFKSGAAAAKLVTKLANFSRRTV